MVRPNLVCALRSMLDFSNNLESVQGKRRLWTYWKVYPRMIDCPLTHDPRRMLNPIFTSNRNALQELFCPRFLLIFLPYSVVVTKSSQKFEAHCGIISVSVTEMSTPMSHYTSQDSQYSHHHNKYRCGNSSAISTLLKFLSFESCHWKRLLGLVW